MEKLYTTAEISDYLKVSELTVRRYIKAGKLESHKIGRQHRISETSLKAYIDAHGQSQKSSKESK
jgi:excisionase family DNA binding protein